MTRAAGPDPTDQANLDVILASSPELVALTAHVPAFATLMNRRHGRKPDRWMTAAAASGEPALEPFGGEEGRTDRRTSRPGAVPDASRRADPDAEVSQLRNNYDEAPRKLVVLPRSRRALAVAVRDGGAGRRHTALAHRLQELKTPSQRAAGREPVDRGP